MTVDLLASAETLIIDIINLCFYITLTIKIRLRRFSSDFDPPPQETNVLDRASKFACLNP